jgi:hypothetical protein
LAAGFGDIVLLVAEGILADMAISGADVAEPDADLAAMADLATRPEELRQVVRALGGDGRFVVGLCGAAGDQLQGLGLVPAGDPPKGKP